MVFYPSKKCSLKGATKKLEFLDISNSYTIEKRNNFYLNFLMLMVVDLLLELDNPIIFIPHLKLIKTAFFNSEFQMVGILSILK